MREDVSEMKELRQEDESTISETMEVIDWYEAHPTYIFSGI